MWEGRLPLPSNHKTEYTSLELCISKIVEDLLLITLSLLSVNIERKTLMVPVTYPEFLWDAEFNTGFTSGCDAPRSSEDLGL